MATSLENKQRQSKRGAKTKAASKDKGARILKNGMLDATLTHYYLTL
jgi:hypothetical protein